MKSFYPTWHPSIAQQYYKLYNDLNQDGSVLYYDSSEQTINMPKVFTYSRINSTSNLILKSVVTNLASDNPTFNPALGSNGSIAGTFTIKKMVGDNANNSPTIDLYCGGKIATVINYDTAPTNDDQLPEGIINVIASRDRSFRFGKTNFPYSGDFNISWESSGGYTLTPSTWQDDRYNYEFKYAGDFIKITNNWNTKDKPITSENSNGSGSFAAAPNTYEGYNGEYPTVYCNWTILFDIKKEQKYQSQWGTVVSGGGDVRSTPEWNGDLSGEGYYGNLIGTLKGEVEVLIIGEPNNDYYRIDEPMRADFSGIYNNRYPSPTGEYYILKRQVTEQGGGEPDYAGYINQTCDYYDPNGTRLGQLAFGTQLISIGEPFYYSVLGFEACSIETTDLDSVLVNKNYITEY